MIKDVIDAGGPSLLIPVVLFALLFYAVRGLFGLHGRRSQHRREFLEQWDPKRFDDDLWLEVTIRHLYGTALPAHVIRTAFEHPHTSQALADLSDLWPFFNYDPETRTVRWQHRRHRHPTVRGLLRHWPVARYFLFAAAAVAGVYLATNVQGLNQWIFSIFAIITGSAAFLSLWHGEAEKAAAAVGEPWIRRINGGTSCSRAMEAEASNPSSD